MSIEVVEEAESRGRRQWALRSAVRLEWLSCAWMVVEGTLSLLAGFWTGSALLVAFGADSLIELVSGGALLWRLRRELHGVTVVEGRQAERLASWIVAGALGLLCVYLLGSGVAGLLHGQHGVSSPLGIGVAVLAVMIMPFLSWRKRHLGRILGSAALWGDAACSVTCAAMAGALLAGLLTEALFGWWWMEQVVALLFLWWLIPETRAASQGARVGTLGCYCDDAVLCTDRK